MESQSRSSILILMIAIVMAVSVVATENVLADDVQENISVIPGRTITPAEERSMARSAAHVLRYIADARSAIAANDIAKARSDLLQALNLIDILKLQQPTAKVRDHIWVARKHLDYESTEEVTADLVPIEADLIEIEDFVPVEKARKHIRSAGAYLKKGDKAGAKKELKAADAALIYTEVDLPLSNTERQIIVAQKALDNRQPAKADKALKQAEDGVQILSIALTAPITKARDSIWQASKAFAARNYAAAKADLAKASEWLDKAAHSTDKTTREEAMKLKEDLVKLKMQMNMTAQGAGAGLSRLWQRSQALVERESEKASAAWGKLHGEIATKEDLIEAKLHLAYAQTAQFVKGKSEEVRSELDKVQSYLDKAVKTSDKALKTKIHTMINELKQIKANLHDKSRKALSRYDKLKADIRQTIHDL